ncbi:MAG: hypothetical protein L6R30_13860 [Thermoanaerobaculia bacterium]|nr:hypothetical protein [Thermoanaerobaculia bacterium]MCK6683489.1 hypothetical protein [Thermoanaerobaculia bacterium]
MSRFQSRAFVLIIWALFLPALAEGTGPLVQVELASRTGTSMESPAKTQAEAEQAFSTADAGFWFPDLGIVRAFRLASQTDALGQKEESLGDFVLSSSAEMARSRFLAKLPAKDLLRSVERPAPSAAAPISEVPRSVAFSDGFETGRLDKWQVLTPGEPYQPVASRCEARTGQYSLDLLRGGTAGSVLTCSGSYPASVLSVLAVPATSLVRGAASGLVSCYVKGRSESSIYLHDFVYVFAMVGDSDYGYVTFGDWPAWFRLEANVRKWGELGDLASRDAVTFGVAFKSDRIVQEGYGFRIDDYAIETDIPLPSHRLEVKKVGSGVVSGQPGGILCGPFCAGTFVTGEKVELSAHPKAGGYFNGWDGDCSFGSPCTLTVNMDRKTTAWFSGPDGDPEMLLAGGRVAVSLVWKNQYSGTAGVGTPVKQMDQYGYFWFDSASNPEVFVKVLDFGGDSFLVFHSALSDLEYAVTFRVLRTNQAYSFKRDAGSVCGLADGSAVKK